MKNASNQDSAPSASSHFALEDNESVAASRAYTLQIVSASGLRSVPLLPGRVLRIGRNRDCDVVIDHGSASRDHAAIYGGDPPEIEDLHSDKGTRVQASRIAPGRRIPLAAGSMIQIADTLFSVRQQASALELPATPAGSRAPSTTGHRGRAVVLDPKMIDLYQLADRLAASSIAVLVLGETGVGKQLVAERIHGSSTRRGRPFSRINCAALAEGVLASELFGHERGAFTGAHTTKIGHFEAAHTGTVFLDEIGELSAEAQAKMLRVLESGEVIRVGSHLTQQVNVRVVSATNRDLSRLVASGRFRPDLFFRLNGVSLVVPPLRERPLDILALAEYFAQSYAAVMGVTPPHLADDAKAALLRYPWPGNVRELKNTIERAVVLMPGAVIEGSALKFDFGAPSPATILSPSSLSSTIAESPRSLPTAPASPPAIALPSAALSRLAPNGSPPSPAGPLYAAQRAERLRSELARAERDRIIEAIAHAGNQAAAAKLLGLSRRALIYRLELYQIARPRKRRGVAGDWEAIVREAKPEEIGWINARYDDVGFVHSTFHREFIAIAEVQGAPAGIGRVVNLDDANAELGGLVVLRDFRHRGVAGRILHFLLEQSRSYERVYCLLFEHLSSFYQKRGFRRCDDSASIPEEIAKKHAWCKERFDDPTLLFVLSPSATFVTADQMS